MAHSISQIAGLIWALASVLDNLETKDANREIGVPGDGALEIWNLR